MTAGLSIDRASSRTTVVTVHGDPLGSLADELASTVGELLGGGSQSIVVDFSTLPVLNSKLLDALVRASAAQRPGPGGIAVVAGDAYVRQVLEISETGGPILIAESQAEALEALGG